MAKIEAKYEIISDKSKNPVTSSEYIKHDEEWLDDVIDRKASTDYVNDAISNIESSMAILGPDGKIPASQLPSYVDDVLEFAKKSDFPAVGEEGKIYVDKSTNLTWRWSGSTYVEISQSLALGETSSTAYAGNKGKQVADNLAAHTGNTTVHITATEREKWNKNSDGNVIVANVKSFGAVGDGETNDSSAVKRAISYAKTNKCPLYFPVGTYIIDYFTLWDDAVIYGEDMNTTILKQLNTVSGSFIFSVWNSAQSKAEITNNVTIKDLTLDGYGNTTTGKGRGLSYYGFRLYLENLTVRGFNGIGISVNRPDEDFAGKHGHMKDLVLYDNKDGNMLYDGETDNNFYNIMAYHNAGIEPPYNIQMQSAGCRIFGMHLWGLADVSLYSNCFGATYTGCHIEGGKSAKIAVYNRMQFFGRIYHHNNDANNNVPAIKAMANLFNCTFVFEGNNLYTLVDLNSKWKANVYLQANVEMISDNLFTNGSFGVNDNIYVNWNYNNNRYVYVLNNVQKIDTYTNVHSVMQTVNETHYNGSTKIFSIEAGNGETNAYLSVVPGNENTYIVARGNSENANIVLEPKGDGAVEFKHKCIYGANYDDFNKTGFYEALGSTTQPTTNSPNGSETNNNFYVLVQKRSDDYISQTAFSVRSDMLVYQRVCVSSVWTKWTRFVKGSDIEIMNNHDSAQTHYYGDSYARIYQAPNEDIYLQKARTLVVIGNTGEDLNECTDPTKLYTNWNGTPGSEKYPVNTPEEMAVTPFHLTCHYSRSAVLIQELRPDNANEIGAVWYRRRTTNGWEPWTCSQNTLPMARKNHLGIDYNSLTTAGMYIAQGSNANPTQNSPDGNDLSNNYVVIVGNPGNSASYFTQTAYSVRSDAKIFHRTCSGGVWSPWRRMATTEDITAMIELME